jgi:hypothetical protein
VFIFFSNSIGAHKKNAEFLFEEFGTSMFNYIFATVFKLICMKKTLFVFAIVAASCAANAQSGKNQIGIGPEVALSTESGGGAQIGGTAKYLHGIGSAGQITVTAGYLFDSETVDGVKATSSQIPILAGYRHNFSGVYVEPQAGFISSGYKESFNGQSASMSQGSFGYAIGGGYAMQQGLDLGISYRNVAESGAKGMIVFRAAWNFSLGGTTSK